MKKISVLFVVVILLATLFVSPVYAAGPANVQVTVRNWTTGGVSMWVQPEGGLKTYYDFPEPGVYTITLPEGKYDFYAYSPCSVEAGNLNVGARKILTFACEGVSYAFPGDTCVEAVWLEEFSWWELNPDWFGIVIDEFGGVLGCADFSQDTIFTPYGE